MLITNYSYINKVLGRNHSGVRNPTWVFKPEVMRNFFCQDSTPNIEQIKRDSFPTGTNPPYSIVLGDKGALLSATTAINGSGTLNGGMAMGRAIAATLEGSSTISTANLSLSVQLACSILATANLTAAMVGKVEMASALAGSGNLTASLKLLAGVVANLTGSGTVTSTLRGTASLECEISPFTELSPENLATAVWNSVAASFNDAGTMGEKLNDAAAGGGGGGGGGTIIREDELAQGGTRFTITLNSAASSQNYLYLGAKIVIISGTGEGQVRTISNYEGAIREATVHYAFTIAPDNTSVYRIIP